MATTTTKTNKPILPRGVDNRPVDSYNRAELYSGKALDFDGVNDILTMPTALTSSLSTTTITHVLNFKTDFSSFASSRDDVFSYSERGIIFTFNFGNIVVYYRHSGGSWGAITIPTDKIKLQEWNHCAIVIDYNNDLGKVYINGHEVVSISSLAGANIAYDSNALTIGAQTGARFFDGQIAGFKIFNTALTAAQVADLYNNPEKVVPTGVDNTALKLWLPMQEGAGTTAYDGSGNGNHGTISGATYVHGIGAPVAQTAVVDWNKGTNLLTESENLDNWTKISNITVASSSDIAPDGSTNSYTLTDDRDLYEYIQHANTTLAGDYVGSIFIKKTTGSLSHYAGMGMGALNSYVIIDTTNGTAVDSGSNFTDILVTSYNDDWWRVSAKATINNGSWPMALWPAISVNGTTITAAATGSNTFWGAQVEQADEVSSYIPTFGTTQTSPVLLPQGLTTGRDITGVNLFENVRKQGALNLDGNSWAEVHDNASLDITGEVTIEFWCKIPQIETNIPHIIGKRDSIDSNWLRLYKNSSGTMLLEGNGGISIGTPTPDETWTHFVATIDGTSGIIYKNGVSSISGYVPFTMVDSAPLSIGAWIYQNGTLVTPTSLTNGQLAQPRIYNRALTAEEVKRNYEVSARELNQYRLLDRYPNAAAAYSLRLLNTDYTGDAIVVRRASDNQTMSIGFFEDELDTQTLESFCSGTDGFVTTWYDQSGNSHNATTAVASEQPKIVSSGTTITQNGKPCIDFNGNNNGYILSDQNLITSLTDGTQTAISVHSVDDVSVGATNLIYSVVDRNSVRHYFAFGYRSNEARAGYYNDSSWSAKDIAASNNTQYLGFNVTVSDETNFYQNNNQAVSGNEPGLDGNQGLSIGKGTNNNFDLTGTIQEVIFYPNDQTNNRSGMQTNINDFYTIY